MSIAYPKIQFQVALRSGQLIGVDQATLEAAYTGTWASVLDGAEVPVSAFDDTILAVEKELAEQIAFDTEQPYRNSLYGISATFTSGATIPTTATGAEAFIGVFSGFVDGSDSTKILTEVPLQTVEDLNETGFFSNTPFYHYALIGAQIAHTRTNAKVTGCIWDYATQETAYNAAGNSPLPQSLENTWVAGVLSELPQDAGWFVQEGSLYRTLYQEGLAMLKSRSLDTPVLPTITGANPVKD